MREEEEWRRVSKQKARSEGRIIAKAQLGRKMGRADKHGAKLQHTAKWRSRKFSSSLCKLMDEASICMSKTKALKALIPTECMQVEQNVYKCPPAPCRCPPQRVLSSFSSQLVERKKNPGTSNAFLNNEMSTVQTRHRQFHQFYLHVGQAEEGQRQRETMD